MWRIYWKTNEMNIVFYGASVTAQSVSHDGNEVTGYVPNAIKFLEALFLESFETCNFYQMGYGGNHFNDAGLIYANDVLDKSPDIVIMDWHTTGLYEFDVESYAHVMRKFLESGAVIITLFLPFKRHLHSQNAIHFKQARGYSRCYDDCKILNFYKIPSLIAGIGDYLRDEVHTTPTGGFRFGRVVADALSKFIEDKVWEDTELLEEYILPPRNSNNIFVSNLECDFQLHAGDRLTLKLSEKSNWLQFYGKVIKGPQSPILNYKYGLQSGSINSWDQWCYYEREALTPLGHKFSGHGGGEVTFDIEAVNPSSNHGFSRLDVVGGIYLVGGELLSFGVEIKVLNIFIFANCHGGIYKRFLEDNILDRVSISHVVSYENLDRFEELKSDFSGADVLIIQPVNQYDDFKIENLKKHLKEDCLIIKVPFVRFEGFWPPNEDKELKKISKDAVMFFPEISSVNQIVYYLTELETPLCEIQLHFENSLNKLKSLEASGDIKFVDFFIKNYKKIPLFRDAYHPTWPFYVYMASELLSIIAGEKSINFKKTDVSLSVGKEFGHYKPIKNVYAKALGLEYDLSSYFVVNRYEFLKRVIEYEIGDFGRIDNIGQLADLLAQTNK